MQGPGSLGRSQSLDRRVFLKRGSGLVRFNEVQFGCRFGGEAEGANEIRNFADLVGIMLATTIVRVSSLRMERASLSSRPASEGRPVLLSQQRQDQEASEALRG